jgi:hypothetical protein
MTNETVSAITTIKAPAEAVFAVLAEPSNHPAIDGTDWVRESLDGQRLTEAWSDLPDGYVPRQSPEW